MEGLYIKGTPDIVPLSISGSAAQTPQLPAGSYKVYATELCFIKIDQGDLGSLTPITAKDIIPKKTIWLYDVAENDRIAIVGNPGSTGTVYIYYVWR